MRLRKFFRVHRELLHCGLPGVPPASTGILHPGSKYFRPQSGAATVPVQQNESGQRLNDERPLLFPEAAFRWLAELSPISPEAGSLLGFPTLHTWLPLLERTALYLPQRPVATVSPPYPAG